MSSLGNVIELRRPTSREQLAELERLYRFAPVGLCMLDNDLRFVHINERLAQIFGRPARDHNGGTLRELIPEMSGKNEFDEILVGIPSLEEDAKAELVELCRTTGKRTRVMQRISTTFLK